MNVTRYVIAGGVSLALHAALLFVTDEPKAFAMPAGAKTQIVSLKFVTPITPAEPASAKPTPPKPIEPTPVKKTVSKPADVSKPKVKPKPVTKKTPAKKAQPKIVKKPVKPAEKVAQKTQLKPAETIKKVEPTKVEPEKIASKPKPTTSGISAQPIMVKKPAFLERPSAPKYPRIARKRGVEGVAMYEIWLDQNGNQVKQVLISSSGTTVLDQSALDAIKKWKFSPHTIGNQTVAHRVQIPVRFKLD
ncbi:energy transducer TonB [Vibrio sp. LaRot3]|uniref:energy transducer TonB n=1 Tax=Vibrio sp. LaRot3 TaxID=2998829 RepID=UPI0022CE0912|nr:energy transducer TonB [Vibrio sp. LaRot3]MDA0150571.1 energy transducer TonB [Vibrio sp. LaRot3]